MDHDTDRKIDTVIMVVFFSILLSLFVGSCTILKNLEKESIQNSEKRDEHIKKHLEDPEKYHLPK